MNGPVPAPKGEKREARALPAIGEPVIVQCANYRCMAYRDREGRWRDWFYKDELPGNVEVIIVC
jgi:hypothetical protein